MSPTEIWQRVYEMVHTQRGNEQTIPQDANVAPLLEQELSELFYSARREQTHALHTLQ